MNVFERLPESRRHLILTALARKFRKEHMEDDDTRPEKRASADASANAQAEKSFHDFDHSTALA